jgi:uncharacterized protein involved in outer membrane biogenesis
MGRSKLIPALLVSVVLLAAGVVAALMFVDPALFRGPLEARATAAFGREVRIAGPIRLERSFTPRLVARKIVIANIKGAADPHFATAEEVGVQVALLPLLWGDLQVLDLHFEGVKLFLQSEPEGAGSSARGDSGDAYTGEVAFPAVERMLIRNAVLSHRSLEGRVTRYDIREARLWNLPGEPERIEAEGAAKGVPIRIQFQADAPAETTGSHLPWSARLEIRCPDFSLVASGRVARAFAWDRFELRFALTGERMDSIERIFDLELRGIGAFSLSGALTAADGVFRAGELNGRVQGADGRGTVTVADGTVSLGRDLPLELELQGALGELPLSVAFASDRPLTALSEALAWPLSGRVKFSGADLEIKAAASEAGRRLDLQAVLRGENLGALARGLGTDAVETGSFRISAKGVAAGGGWQVDALEGEIDGLGPWKRLRVTQGRGAGDKEGGVSASLSAELDQVPITISFEGGDKTGAGSHAGPWPFTLEATAAGAALTAAGSVVDSPGGRRLEAATRLTGRRLERLGGLIGTSLPPVASYDVSGVIAHEGGVYELRDLSARIGESRLAGSLQWDGARERPLLTGRLAAERLVLRELQAASPSRQPPPAPLDRPIGIDWLRSFDTRLRLEATGVAGSPLPIERVSADVTLAGGRLDASLRGRAAGASLNGQVQVTAGAVPAVSWNAEIGPIDAAQTLRQLNVPLALSGAVKAVDIKGRSAGKTLRALLEQAEFSVRVHPAGLKGSGAIMRRRVDITLAKADATVRRGRPAAVVLSGTLNRVPFDATIAAGSLAELYRPDTPLPVRLALRAGEVRLTAEGTVARPFSRLEFDFAHELTGKEIKGLDPLMDIVLPLQGAFHAKGRVAARGNRFTYEEDLRVGRSDLKALLTVSHVPPRPAIEGRIQIRELHLDDLILSGAGPHSAAAPGRAPVIPDHPLPVEILRAADLDLVLKAGRVVTGAEPLGDLAAEIKIQNGRYHSVHSVSGFLGGRMEGEVDIAAAADPPTIGIRLQAEELDYRFLQTPAQESSLIEGRIALYAELAGAGRTVRGFLADAEGRLTLIGGPGRISDRRVDLWAADLLPTMLSPRWQRDNVTDMNCAVAHIKVSQGLAHVEDFLLDTRRITVAGSGLVNLDTEGLDLLLAPRPKRTSLVSLANPVRIGGTLAEPEVSAARLPSRRRLVRTGLLAGLVNPLFLLTTFADTGTGSSNPCVRAVERANQTAGSNDAQ